PAAGGEICIGPGTWQENVVLDQRRSILFTGCGARTRWLPADRGQPLLTITRCEGIRLRRLRMEAVDAPCVLAVAHASGGGNSDLAVEDCALLATSGGVLSIDTVQGLAIQRCRVESGPMTDPTAANAGFAAITMQGYGLVLRDSQVLGVGGRTAQELPLGGVHVKGNSRDVTIVDNRIGD